MNKDPFFKLQSSQTFEELMEDSHKPGNQNWLISYLDVFVLILMFIITLIALSDFSVETEPKALITTPQPIKKPKPALPKAERIIKEPPPAIETKPESAVAPFIGPPKPQIEKPEEAIVSEKITLDIEPEETFLMPEPETTPQETLQSKLSEKLEQMGLDKSVAIKVTEDYAQLEIQDNILFESSQANLTDPGKHLLDDLVPLLQQAVGLIFIEGHTDNRPIKTVQFPSNWELGAARATSVLHYLTTQGLESTRMRAVTYADTQPIADNDTPEGREMNRRVNILIKVKEQTSP
ncbi:OmpA/MotB family protein [Methylotuvimicrobium alcaliphilum]|uniref:OmpA/MotB domain protein n=1 Tax=Methylotuvimicrobium alcaliphilum (strain DSM 19304 / NCIMB 14124 / VKM B-2133 / 20Z) TaxID=1091494 RepID=G4SX02_META2|nr:OmpA family protein [Methylotuvimicrobium alcaliphilum]CCE23057.1 OmpA/MotB domain protein [Methylotuvimicrobium alcaliphilum 20Z]